MNANFSHQTEFDEAVLGAILVDEDARNLAMTRIGRDDFAREINSIIFEAVHDLYHKQAPFDRYTVASLLAERNLLEAVGGRRYLMTLAENATPWHIEYHIEQLIEASKRRKLKLLAQEAADMDGGAQEIADYLLHGIDQIQASRQKREARWLGDITEQVMATIEERAKTPGKPWGLRTDLRYLDKLTGGFQRQDLIILAARTSVGKTTFATALCQQVADNQPDGGAVIIFSYEMAAQQLALKMLCGESGVPMNIVRSGFLRSDEIERMQAKQYTLRGIENLFVCESSGFTVDQVRAECRRLKNKRGLQMIAVDYIQLVTPYRAARSAHNESRQQQVGAISRGLKSLAIEFDIPVVALAQVNRLVEQRKDKTPTLADLRESGDLEQDADLVMFLYRPEQYDETDRPGEMDLIIAKHRNGPLGTITFRFDAALGRFEEASSR